MLAQNLTQEEREQEIVNYSNIRRVLVEDGLDIEKNKKELFVSEIKKERKKIIKDRYQYPQSEDFFSVMTEYWLVKNAQVLRWDFPKPEYGIKVAFGQLLEKFGFYNVEFKILIVNTPIVTHFGLPSGKKSYTFVLSLPFMRSLDLTKVDISLLLLEDFLRLEKGYFISNLNLNKSFMGTNFQKKKIDKTHVSKALKRYNEVIFKTGFNFQQQYGVTKEIDKLLKSDLALWGAYFKLYKKLERFIKADLLYKSFLKIYPSPELQLQWLSPKKKII